MKRLLLCFVLAALPRVAVADEATPSRRAQELFDQGRRAFAQGRVDEACKAFEASMAAEPANGTLLNLARCHERQGKLELARAEYQRVAAVASRDGQVARGKIARARAADLDGTTAHPDAAVPVSGTPPAAPPPADKVPPPKEDIPYFWIGLVSGSVGIASLTVGSVLGAVALSDLTHDDPDDDGCATDRCFSPTRDEVQESESQGDAAIALLAVGSVLAVTGGTFLTLAAIGEQDSTQAPKGRVALVPGFGGASLHVTW
ncbi:MAG: tetratricopeptide repeat protein [Polyangiaceae bacterium]|nr:tetratricopeptide repeat protein [Polyangiaceae bacterium]